MSKQSRLRSFVKRDAFSISLRMGLEKYRCRHDKQNFRFSTMLDRRFYGRVSQEVSYAKEKQKQCYSHLRRDGEEAGADSSDRVEQGRNWENDYCNESSRCTCLKGTARPSYRRRPAV